MRVNTQLELSDEQRDAVATLLDGRETRRLVTREELRQFVAGAVDYLVQAATKGGHNARAVQRPVQEVRDAHPGLQGKSDSYLRGWDNAGRIIAASRGGAA